MVSGFTKALRDKAGFCSHGPVMWQQERTGPLATYRLAVKDLFAVEGYKNSAGNPDWYESHPLATKTADAVARLMSAGTHFVGFTHTDELAYSLEGNNAHFGASENPKKSGHACGGSSMGSAAAVASGWADIGLGTDTGGSIRVPSSYCGLFGLRPSHDTVSTQGLIHLAPSFDTVGWFTRDAETLLQVGSVLLPQTTTNIEIDTLVVCEDLFDLVDQDLKDSLKFAVEKIAPYFKQLIYVDLIPDDYDELNEVFRVLQGREIATTHKDWIAEVKPTLTETVTARMKMALSITDKEVTEAKAIQNKFIERLNALLPTTSVLFLPTTPSVAPPIGADVTSLRNRLLKLTAIAGLSGSPQAHLPLLPHAQGNHASFPYGFSLLAAKYSDMALLNCIASLTEYWNQGSENTND